MKNLLIFTLIAALFLAGSCSEDSDVIIDSNGEEPPPATVVIRVPADQPTIQAGINAASDGDTVLVSDGIYQGDGNRDIEFGGKSVVLVSTGGPANTVIDCEGDSTNLHLGFNIAYAGDSGVVIDGFTIRGGFSSQGSAVNFRTASPTIRNCVFAENVALISGGAIRCKSSSPVFENCSFVGNSAPTGSVAFLLAGAEPTFNNCIIAFSTGGDVIVCADTSPSFSCCDIYGNEGGDWIGCFTSLINSAGNQSADPMFCDTSAANYHLEVASPCAPANNSCGELVGALDPDC